MMKAGRIAALALAAVMMIPSTAFAGTWTKGKIRTEDWKYIKDNGSYASGWLLIDGDKDGIGEYYYFDQGGWLQVSAQTPDGYQTNEEGQWVVDGVVQHGQITGDEEKGSIQDMPAGEYKQSYIVYNYGERVGTESHYTVYMRVAGHYRGEQEVVYRTVYDSAAEIEFYREFTKLADGTYGYGEGDGIIRLSWDPINNCIMTITEDRYTVYDLVGTGMAVEQNQ